MQLAAYCHGELISPGHASALFHSVSPSHQGTGYQLGAFLIGSDGIKQLIFKTVQSHEHIARIRHSLQGRDVGAHERMHLFHLLQALTGYQAGQICAVFGVQVLHTADVVGQLLPGALAGCHQGTVLFHRFTLFSAESLPHIPFLFSSCLEYRAGCIFTVQLVKLLYHQRQGKSL